MSKELTPERIERGYKRWVRVAWGFRAFWIAYAAIVLYAVVFVGLAPFYLLYILAAALWYAYTYFWISTAKHTRDTQYRTLDLRNQTAELRKRWAQ